MTDKTELRDLFSRVINPLIADAVETALEKMVKEGKMDIPGQPTQKENHADEQWWTIDQFCAYAHVSRPTYHSFVHRGFIRPRKCGQRTLICVSEVKEQMDHGEFGKYVRIIKKQ